MLKGLLGIFPLLLGFFVFPLVLIVLALFFFKGKRKAKQVWKSYFFISFNMVLISFTFPAVSGYTALAFSFLQTSDQSILFKVSAYTCLILCLLLIINTVTQMIILAKAQQKKTLSNNQHIKINKNY